jgi:hypothetical protein
MVASDTVIRMRDNAANRCEVQVSSHQACNPENATGV